MISKDSLKKFLSCEDDTLLEKILLAFQNLEKIPQDQDAYIAFSGGKDSHCVLGIYLAYCKILGKEYEYDAVFSDTLLEEQSLYDVVDIVGQIKGLTLKRTLPIRNFFYYQFALGYPVPNYSNRWCTNYLKVKPMKNLSKGKVAITGRHKGESAVRDERLKKSCGSSECGMDLLKQGLDPISHFTNCDVWDTIFYLSGVVFPDNTFNRLSQMYEASESTKKGSLRMGCVFCPVVSVKTLQQRASKDVLYIRYLLEELRKARRINSPRTKKAGAIYIVDRFFIWKNLDKDLLIKKGFITREEVNEITSMLKNGSYPPTYKKEWIKQEHLKVVAQ